MYCTAVCVFGSVPCTADMPIAFLISVLSCVVCCTLGSLLLFYFFWIFPCNIILIVCVLTLFNPSALLPVHVVQCRDAKATGAWALSGARKRPNRQRVDARLCRLGVARRSIHMCTARQHSITVGSVCILRMAHIESHLCSVDSQIFPALRCISIQKGGVMSLFV